jgi:cyclopropane fatty-acyl-phospholipid synthase-like methyltransferase
MFEKLTQINHRPKVFEHYTTPLLWNDPYVSQQMLELHLSETVDLASRNKKFIQKSCVWILNHFEISPLSKICDFGCGPGLYTTAFAKHGAQVTGIDLSENSIHYAKEVAKRNRLSITYCLQNYLEYTPKEQFNLITMIYCDFTVLSPQQRKTLLNTFYNSLEENGSILFDVFTIDYFNTTSEKRAYEYVPCDGFWSKNHYYAFTNTFKYESEKLILDKHTIIEERSTKEIFNWMQCYSIHSLEKELNASGFYISEVYSDVAGHPYQAKGKEIAIIAKKMTIPKQDDIAYGSSIG